MFDVSGVSTVREVIASCYNQVKSDLYPSHFYSWFNNMHTTSNNTTTCAASTWVTQCDIRVMALRGCMITDKGLNYCQHVQKGDTTPICIPILLCSFSYSFATTTSPPDMWMFAMGGFDGCGMWGGTGKTSTTAPT